MTIVRVRTTRLYLCATGWLGGPTGDVTVAQRLAFINPRLSTRNVGDLFIEDSVKRILVYDRRQSIDVDPRRPLTARDVDRINACDAAVIVGTNLWYRDMLRRGCWRLALNDLKKIRVPIIPFGVGTTRHDGEDNRFEPETLDHIKLVHDSCPLASARDWRTAEALKESGIGNVAMTGCPTLFRSLRPEWRLVRNPSSKRVVVTVRKGQRHNLRVLIRRLRQLGLEPVVAAQQDKDLFLRHSLPFVQRAVPTLYEYDLAPYLQLVEESLGVIGWRLHGNMLHLAHGKPAVYFANCSRAESFCASFGLPSCRCEDGERLSRREIFETADRLFDESSFAGLPGFYAEYRNATIAFLEANGLAHNLRPGAAAAAA